MDRPGADEAQTTQPGSQGQPWGPGPSDRTLTREGLKAWLDSTGRRWMVIDALQWVDALWSESDGNLDILSFQAMVAKYKAFRQAIPTGEVKTVVGQVSGRPAQVPVLRSDVLDVAEMDRVVRHLIGEITQRDPSWKLEGPGR